MQTKDKLQTDITKQTYTHKHETQKQQRDLLSKYLNNQPKQGKEPKKGE